MTFRTTMLILATTLVAVSCSRFAPGLAGGTKKGTIVLYRDAANNCKSVTTRYMKKSKNQDRSVQWKVDDEFDCQSQNGVIELRFALGQDPLPNCQKKTEPGKKAIECDLATANTTNGAVKYQIFLDGNEIEDPELEIAN